MSSKPLWKNSSNLKFYIQLKYQYVWRPNTFMLFSTSHSIFFRKLLNDMLNWNKSGNQEIIIYVFRKYVSSTEVKENRILRTWSRMTPRWDLYFRYEGQTVQLDRSEGHWKDFFQKIKLIKCLMHTNSRKRVT